MDTTGEPRPHTPHAPSEYATYLRIPELLDLQDCRTPASHDELLFIIVHQQFELWFKLIIHELLEAIRLISSADTTGADIILDRVEKTIVHLCTSFDILDTMPVDHFLEFRDPLAPASGGQSWQYHEILSLLADPNSSVTSVWQTFLATVQLPDGRTARMGTREERTAALAALYHEHSTPTAFAQYRLMERLIGIDVRVALWKERHVLLAERHIGRRTGTGGTSGVSYLLSHTEERLFPELWDVRSAL